MELELQTTGIDGLADGLDGRIEEAARTVLDKSAMLAARTAVRYAPRSPTQQQKDAARKTRRKVHRKAGSHSRPNPGGLMRSITSQLNSGLSASVFVASNSEAASYAEKMHDEKGKTWFNRGIGTIAKGAKADDKFIERAVREEVPEIEARLEKAILSVF